MKCFSEISTTMLVVQPIFGDRPTNAKDQSVEYAVRFRKLGERTSGIKPFFRYVTPWVDRGRRYGGKALLRETPDIFLPERRRVITVIRYILKRKLPLFLLRPRAYIPVIKQINRYKRFYVNSTFKSDITAIIIVLLSSCMRLIFIYN